MSPPDGGGRLILVIDDDAVDRKQVIRWLGDRFAVCEAATARVGLDTARRLRPGCVLLDYRLTDASGLGTLEELARLDLPVVLLTGQGDEDVAVRALKAGAQDYLVKDRVTRDELNAAVSRALATAASRRRSDAPPRDVEGFERLADELLRPGLDAVRRACAAALEEAPALREPLGAAIERVDELARNVAGLEALAGVDRLCGDVDTVDLAEVGRRVAARAGDDPELAGLAVEVGPLPLVRGAPAALERMLLDLVRCAAWRTSGGRARRVTIGAEREDDAWRVHVADDGPPPGEAELTREVFLPYRRGAGRDLLLATCGLVARRHGGEAWVEPGDGGGRRVVVRLPAPSELDGLRPPRP